MKEQSPLASEERIMLILLGGYMQGLLSGLKTVNEEYHISYIEMLVTEMPTVIKQINNLLYPETKNDPTASGLT